MRCFLSSASRAKRHPGARASAQTLDAPTMHRSRVAIALLSLLAACSSAPQTPKAWAQTPEESTTLPVGTVVSVERESYSTGKRTDPATTAGMSGAAGPLAAAAAVTLIDAFRGTGTAYRHGIRLKATGEVV